MLDVAPFRVLPLVVPGHPAFKRHRGSSKHYPDPLPGVYNRCSVSGTFRPL